MPTSAQLLAEAERLRNAGDVRRALALCEQVLRVEHPNPSALHLMALLAAGQGQLRSAIHYATSAVASAPDQAEYQLTLGTLELTAGAAARAVSALNFAARRMPASYDAWANLGSALASVGRTSEAAAAMEQAIALEPLRDEAYANRAQLARRSGRLTEGVEILQRAIARGVSGPRLYNNLGGLLRLLGRVDEAVGAFRRALELDPALQVAWHNYLYALLFHAGSGPEQIAEAQRRWSAQIVEPLRSTRQPHENDPSPDRRLRIGYVSPNLKDRPVGVFMEPVLTNHDKAQFEVYCYAEGDGAEDARARTLRGHADVWRDTRGFDHAGLAELVRLDRIDILVDLNQHMGGSRLLAFARKPAPVQVAYLGYAAGTGLDAIDYRLGDPSIDPPSSETAADVEEVVRLPETYWCYRPPAGALAVSDPPSIQNGYPTFGSFNAAAKVNPEVVAVWSRLLRAVPSARLLVILTGIDESDPHWRRLFARHGIGDDRLQFLSYLPYHDYLRAYGQIDVALDSFPYNGGTTTLDGLWMGVPTVTLAGRSGVSRAGVSILTNAGLRELVAASPEEYVSIASRLAGDVNRLRELRSSLRNRLRQSPLMDEKRFVHDLEHALRQMWRRWCEGRRR